MKKIISYIAQGQGIGLKYLALLALILGILGGIGTKVIATEGIPLAQQVADQLLPIKVVNGQIVDPQETYKVVHLRFGDDENAYPIPIVLDTTSDMLDIDLLDQGVYITRSYLYMINEHEARTYKLDGDFNLAQKDYTPEFTSFINWTAFLVGAFIFGGLFVFYFLLALIFSFVAGLIAASKKIVLDFNTKMRLSSVALIACVLVFWILRLAGNINMWLAALIIIALQIYFVRCLMELYMSAAEEINSQETTDTKEEVVALEKEKQPTNKAKKLKPKKESVKTKASAPKTAKALKKKTSKAKAKENIAEEAKPQKKRGRKPKA